jgi:hypothetical protein
MAERTTAEAVAGLVAGLELVVVHLAKTVAAKTGTPTEELAASFEATAAAIGDHVRSADLMRLALRHVSSGLRGASSAGLADDVQKLLH